MIESGHLTVLDKYTRRRSWIGTLNPISCLRNYKITVLYLRTSLVSFTVANLELATRSTSQYKYNEVMATKLWSSCNVNFGPILQRFITVSSMINFHRNSEYKKKCLCPVIHYNDMNLKNVIVKEILFLGCGERWEG